ncbi:MAG: serine hydrolase [Saprospiraceae bacterium]|nr:serine hydrolase [Saprospiraceae bacterium]
MVRKLLAPLFLIFIAYCLNGQNLYFPSIDPLQPWATMDPDELDWCDEKIDELYDFLEEKNSKGFIILKDGKIVLEKYFDTFTEDSIWYYASAGKSVMAFMLGIAQKNGALSIDDKTNQYLGNGWTACTPEQEDEITIRHQITMTTGLEVAASSGDDDCLDPECMEYFAPPGTRWDYYNAPYRLTQDVIEAAVGINKNFFFRQYITNTTGMNGLWFNYIFYGRTRDMARFGLLNLAGGIWNGNPILNDPDYFYEMTHPSQSLNPGYGYLWWLNGSNFHLLPGTQFQFQGSVIPNAPDDMFAALGKNDQKIYVVPSMNMVVVRCGNSAGGVSPALSSFDNELWAKILDLECTSSSTELENSNAMVVYPNPSRDGFSLEVTDPVIKVSLLDYNGQEVWMQPYNNESSTISIQWPMKTAPGLYLLKVDHQNGIAFKKLVRL